MLQDGRECKGKAVSRAQRSAVEFFPGDAALTGRETAGKSSGISAPDAANMPARFRAE